MKAQVQQVFIFALTAVIVGLVLLLGYKFISSTLSKGCDVELVTFQGNLERELMKAKSYGSYRIVDLPNPCGAEKLCFVDNDTIIETTTTPEMNNVVKASVSNGISTNIFLEGETTEPIDIPINITTKDDNPYYCVPQAGGRIRFGVRGGGNYIEVEELE